MLNQKNELKFGNQLVNKKGEVSNSKPPLFLCYFIGLRSGFKTLQFIAVL